MSSLAAVLPTAGTDPKMDLRTLSVAVLPPLRVAIEASAKESTSAIVIVPMLVVSGVLPPSDVMGVRLCTKTFPLWIDEVSADNFNFGFHLGQWADEAHFLALAVAAVFHKAKRDVVA